MVIFQLQQFYIFAAPVISILRDTQLLTAAAVLPAESNIQRGHPYLQLHRGKEREEIEGGQGREYEQKMRTSDTGQARKWYSTGSVKQWEIKWKECKNIQINDRTKGKKRQKDDDG